ncbi:hypothetical protein CCM_03984 [Cordyceps militaris CM01]|uniref:Uncharacterized protein n=1 Tax=Cordyceps militaris (strain CM01) TaxID=983644 RepID=G3JDD6_CORMM|nr:uncharacterized protein CCM_03984 [Cordyceps militaris CM01]EGX92611.1 hypothetical protein CCM_03984 [Cordyceps militaris CM01]
MYPSLFHPPTSCVLFPCNAEELHKEQTLAELGVMPGIETSDFAGRPPKTVTPARQGRGSLVTRQVLTIQRGEVFDNLGNTLFVDRALVEEREAPRQRSRLPSMGSRTNKTPGSYSVHEPALVFTSYGLILVHTQITTMGFFRGSGKWRPWVSTYFTRYCSLFVTRPSGPDFDEMRL